MNPKPIFLAALVAAFSLPGVAISQEKKQAPTAQQERMKACNAQATEKALTGQERQTFMSSCLKADPEGKKPTAQQERMKTCNAQAASKALKGDERKQFMSSCLKG